MNWNAIAALAQVLAAIGVIVSVVYLALQVRRNTQQARLNTESLGVTHEMGGAAMSVNIGLAIAGDADLAGILQRADTREDPLTPVEWVRFNALLYAAVAGFQAGFYNYRRDSPMRRHGRATNATWSRCWGSAAARTWWARERGRFSPGLVAHLDDLLAAAPRGAPAPSSNSDPEGQ